MYNKTFIVTVFFIVTVLFLFFGLICVNTSFSCQTGPCIDLNNSCTWGGGMGTCHYDWDLAYCTGVCTSLCWSGDPNNPFGKPDEYCLNFWWWSCTQQMVICGPKTTYRCTNGMLDPVHCVCESWNPGGNCNRQDC
jgi:hypothetical protein